MSANVNPGEFEQLVPLQSVHATVQSNPCFRHVHLLDSQVDLQLHLIIFSNSSGAAGSFDFRGKSLLSNVYHPQSFGFNPSPAPIQHWHCRKARILWNFAAQILVAKCAPEHKRFLLQPSMQICDIVEYLNFHLRFHHTK